MKKIVNFLCEEELIKAFDEKIKGTNRTEAIIILLEAVVNGKIEITKEVKVVEK